ncbi:alpha/beta hydrolase [Streptomyces sp. VRA16 Mangrove soil]|uniref:alpha/beta hydrolase n=1 Tax=Streptomyces sp. VRA16 Mangrove soil TaxID=2817434 RepID=UPI001A9D0CF8|nr:alpha/beta hydrolase [Streptomyces sp. VRA16 Mangrove soil]MBO1334263.1 alpha/beta hydrolase [Streptomyces sp. VRA16 Mangrove soil]
MTRSSVPARAGVLAAALALVAAAFPGAVALAGTPQDRTARPTAAAARPAPAAGRPAQRIVDVPVAFEVRNLNRTDSQCTSDGKKYTIRGHLTGPERELRPRGGKRPPVTLYVHGTNTGEWIWRLGVEGRDYTRELAERGHVSLTIDRLGYGASDIPDGFDSCSGAHADIAHQIVERLKRGSYDVEGAEPVRFGKVFLGGHSSGALVAETVAASFGDVDGLVLTGWAAVGVTGETNRRFLAAYSVCQKGGEPKRKAGDPRGYVHFDPVREDFLAGGLGPDADPAVTRAITGLWPRNPCGVMASEPAGILTDLRLIGRIKAPVFLAFGAKDVLRQGVERYPALFTASTDVRSLTLARSGHFVTVDKDAPLLYDAVDRWLDSKS